MMLCKIWNKKINEYLYVAANKDTTLISSKKGIEKKFKITLLTEAIPNA